MPGQEANDDNLGKSFRSSIHNGMLRYSLESPG